MLREFMLNFFRRVPRCISEKIENIYREKTTRNIVALSIVISLNMLKTTLKQITIIWKKCTVSNSSNIKFPSIHSFSRNFKSLWKKFIVVSAIKPLKIMRLFFRLMLVVITDAEKTMRAIMLKNTEMLKISKYFSLRIGFEIMIFTSLVVMNLHCRLLKFLFNISIA